MINHNLLLTTESGSNVDITINTNIKTKLQIICDGLIFNLVKMLEYYDDDSILALFNHLEKDPETIYFLIKIYPSIQPLAEHWLDNLINQKINKGQILLTFWEACKYWPSNWVEYLVCTKIFNYDSQYNNNTRVNLHRKFIRGWNWYQGFLHACDKNRSEIVKLFFRWGLCNTQIIKTGLSQSCKRANVEVVEQILNSNRFRCLTLERMIGKTKLKRRYLFDKYYKEKMRYEQLVQQNQEHIDNLNRIDPIKNRDDRDKRIESRLLKHRLIWENRFIKQFEQFDQVLELLREKLNDITIHSSMTKENYGGYYSEDLNKGAI